MGKRSVKANKNIWQRSREESGMTRAQASEAMQFVSESRLEKIESEKTAPHPEDVLAMAAAYKKPGLSNHFCSHECPIGKKDVPVVEDKALTQIVLETLSLLNQLDREKNRLIAITADGVIDDDELTDFALIEQRLLQIGQVVDSLKLWIDNTIASGAIDRDKLDAARRAVR